ncbi:MAG: hypothetical protein MK209_07745 [Planctomycetes bacterium]|nr:hypothetical protein [Planctomycetota bacterium]
MVDFNNAFPMLANPAKRAELLLNWLGASPTQGTDAEADPAFLMQMMELREEAEEVQAAASQNPTPALEFITRMREAESQLLAHFAAGFTALSAEAKAQAGSAAANQEDSALEVRALRRIFYELRYHQRTREQLETTLQPGFNQIP